MVCFLRDRLGKLTCSVALWMLALLMEGCGGRATLPDVPGDSLVGMPRVVAGQQSPKQPLPTFSCWNTGQSGPGWRPSEQLKFFSQAPGWLPWFDLYADLMPRSVDDEYFRASWVHAREQQLPVHFVSDNLVDSFRTYRGPGNWREAREESDHPWVVRENGSFVKLASPLGTKSHWFELGKIIGTALKPFAETYVPPYVLLSDNNEAGFVRLRSFHEDYRLAPLLAGAAPGEEREALKRRIYREGLGERYQLMRKGIEAAVPEWEGRVHIMGYGTFGQKFGVSRTQAHPNRYNVPWVTPEGQGKEDLTHQGVWSNIGYLTYRKHHQVASGAVESCNLQHAWHHFEQQHHPFIKGQIFWQVSNRAIGLDHWMAHIRCCMWLSKPEHVMYFLSSSKFILDGEDWFLALRAAVFEIHKDPVLRRHWLTGQLLENPEGHPYQEMLPDAYKDPVSHRWFLLDVPINKRFDEEGRDRWQLDRARQTIVDVWAFVSEVNMDHGKTERLIYACSTFQKLKNTEVKVPGVGMVMLPEVSKRGEFYLLLEDGSVQRHQTPLDEIVWN